jgi:predicted Fe-S protein YdhL (DUF1289 family)
MTFLARPQPIESPCNKICTVLGEHCIGCGRTLAEIANWIGYSDGERARIMAELPERLASLREGGSHHAKPS